MLRTDADTSYAAIAINLLLSSSCLFLNYVMLSFYSCKQHRGKPTPALYRAMNRTNIFLGRAFSIYCQKVVTICYFLRSKELLYNPTYAGLVPLLHTLILCLPSGSPSHSRLILVALVLFYVASRTALFTNLALSCTRWVTKCEVSGRTYFSLAIIRPRANVQTSPGP